MKANFPTAVYPFIGFGLGYLGYRMVENYELQKTKVYLGKIKAKNLMRDQTVFRDGNLFLKSNLKELAVLKSDSNQIELGYWPKIDSQGHFSVCHGGFTASMVEYGARAFLQLSDRHVELKKFDIKYTKPIVTENFYRLKIKLDEKNKNMLEYEIFDSAQKSKYAYGKLEVADI